MIYNVSVHNAYKYVGTLGTHTEMDGVPFVFNPAISTDKSNAFDVSSKHLKFN